MPRDALDAILGESPAIAVLRGQIRHLASFDSRSSGRVPTVLLQGATGTGKGLVARLMHECGGRARGPFVDVNCAAIPDTMLEAELFGFEAGAFTDARRPKPGLFEAASGGTLFLDEIDSLPLALQGKVLKAIEDKHVRRLGATTGRTVDVKLVAATQQDLAGLVASGRFRSDLYHRLAVLVLAIPPLAERGDDVLLLAERFLDTYAEAHGIARKRLTPDASAWLRACPWPGNVRELEHAMERVTLLVTDAAVDRAALERLAPGAAQPAGASTPRPSAAPEPDDERPRIQSALQRAGGNVARAARLLGLGRNALRYRMRRLGIDRPGDDGAWSDAAEPPATVVPQSGAPAWEQKPVAVLAITLSLPESSDERGAFEPWTVAVRWDNAIRERVQAFGGHVIGRSPARTTAVFGLPRALEHAGDHAVQAALALGRLAAAETPRPDLRCAAHVGEVRIDVARPDAVERLLPIGDVLALPERLLGHAAPGEVLVSAQLARRIATRRALEPRALRLGPRDADAVTAHVVVVGRPATATETREDAGGLTPFVGRAHELDVLLDAFARTAAGHGQVVFVAGDAGLGKSRLLAELRRRLGAQPHRWVEGRCASYGMATPFLPIIDGIRRSLGIDDHDDDGAVTAKIRHELVRAGGDLDWTLPLVQRLLSLDVADTALHALDAAQRRSELFRALSTLLLRSAAREPLVLVIEDLHWIDPASEEFLGLVADALPAHRVLLVLSHRVGYRHPFGDRSFHQRVTLPPLSGGEMHAVTAALAGGATVSDDVQALVSAKAEGNPFFVEELTRWLFEAGSLVERDGRIVLASDRLPVTVPSTIQDVLVARIDRLAEPSRHAMQIASVIGREFALRLLARISEAGEHLRSQVDELRGLELIYEKALHPEVAYMFKHALTHDVAYESVRTDRRMALHRAIGRTIEELYADRLAEHVETLAHHFTRGEDWDRALTYHERAADKAEEHHASRAVVEHARAGLGVAAHLGERVGAARRRALWERLGRAHLYLSDFADSAAAYEQAADCAASDEERSVSFTEAANSHIWAHHYDAGRRVLATALALARTCGSPAAESVALATQGFVRAVLDADVEDLSTLAKRAVTLAMRQGSEPAEGLARTYVMMHDEWVGRFPDALDGARTSLALGRKLRSPQLVIWPTWFGGKARCCTGDFGGALVQLEEAYSVCDRIGDRAWKSRMLNTIGWCYAEIGAPDRAGEFNERAAVLARELGDPEILANAAINLARNHLALGSVERAAAELAPIEAELAHGTDPWMRWRWSLHAYDVRARIALARGAFDAALVAANLEHEGAARHGLPKLLAGAALLRGETLLALERWDEAEAVLADAQALGERLGWARGQWDAARLLAVHARRRGAAARADEHRARARAVAERAAASLGDDALRRRLLDAAVRES